MTSAVYCNKELSLALQKKGIEAHRVIRFEEGGGGTIGTPLTLFVDGLEKYTDYTSTPSVLARNGTTRYKYSKNGTLTLR